MAINPKKIVCLSGKRKSGKDYVAELLHGSRFFQQQPSDFYTYFL